jgi:hypothetical protein
MCSKSTKTLSEQRKIVKSLIELLENEKTILEKLEPNENPKEVEIAEALIDELLCPISYSFMIDPVVLTSGKTYDRTAINAEFKRQKEQYPEKMVKCPFTTITQVTDFLIPNMQMRSITSKFVEKYKNNTYKGPSWNEIRRLCLDYLEEQKPQKVEERQLADEQRFEEQKRIQEQKKADEEEFEKQKKESKQRAKYGFELEEFCLLYGEFFRFYQESRKPLYTGYANKNKFQRNYHINIEILKKWEQNKKNIPNNKISGCLYIFMEYYLKKNLIIN